jgi:hypothetical protein
LTGADGCCEEEAIASESPLGLEEMGSEVAVKQIVCEIKGVELELKPVEVKLTVAQV